MSRDEQIIAEAKKHYDDINCLNAFVHGVGWAELHPVDVWHDASEEPKEDVDILFISKNGKVHKVSKIDLSLYDWLKDNDDIKRWAYIKDLLPKQFGNSKQVKGGEQ